jgi:glycosyltransferase involved in cell wall biosynthesis
LEVSLNILINFSSLKSGGGQNVAMNFLLGIGDVKLTDVRLIFLVARDSEPHKHLKKIGYSDIIVAPRNPLTRIVRELIFGRQWVEQYEIDIVYSYFGYALLPRSVCQVTGSADSNLYFPEVEFWKDYSWIKRLGKKLIDMYRVFGIRRANAVVFENPDLLERGRKLYGLKNVKYIKPSINFEKFDDSVRDALDLKTPYPKGLFLCGWHLNKNIMRIPEIASQMHERGKPMSFVITASMDGSDISKDFQRYIDSYDVEEFVQAIGNVTKSKLPALYACCDIIFLLSKLESFSNNILEAWYFRKPLVVSDESWSRAICKDAALYVDRNSIVSIADAIQEVLTNRELNEQLIRNGERELSYYPSIAERILEEKSYLVKLHENV